MEAGVTKPGVCSPGRTWRAGLLGLALAVCLGVPATAMAVDSSDGVATDVFRNGTEIDVYYHGADNGVWERVYSDGGGWSAPFELPGTAGIAASSPAADSVAPASTERRRPQRASEHP